MKNLLAIFGAAISGRETYCFADKTHGLYLYIRPMNDRSGNVSSLFLSSFPNCQHLPVIETTIDPLLWRTPEGIGIGSTKDEIFRAYGKPAVVHKLDAKSAQYIIAGLRNTDAYHLSVGDTGYLYSCLSTKDSNCLKDNRATEIYLNGGTVISISASNDE